MSIELHIEALDFHLVVFRLDLVLRHIDDGVIFFDLHQHPLAVERDLIIVHVAQHRFFALFHVVNAEMRFLVSLAE